MKYVSALKTKLIYVFAIPDELHRGCLKIGETTIDEVDFQDLYENSSALNRAAKKRIDSYTKTAGIPYQLLYTEPSFSIKGASVVGFNDKAVHEVLKRSGIPCADLGIENQGTEWFRTDLETVKKAIQAAKEGRSALENSQITTNLTPIVLRPEQREAVDKTIRRFQSGHDMLWYAKMRFGKTVCALQVVKEMNAHRTLILTHRPVVDKGWFEDFSKIFVDTKNFRYGSRNCSCKFEELESDAQYDPNSHYVYFASLQDLRGSELTGGRFDKNTAVFEAKWDIVIIDEGHEGTQTELGQNVIKAVKKRNTRVLNLSGTPFNILDDYEAEDVFTWTYIDEQAAKQKWDMEHLGDINPYADLPRLNMFTFDLGKLMAKYSEMGEMAFNFKEFFRTWTGDVAKDGAPVPSDKTIGDFVHEKDVLKFLDIIVSKDDNTNYPFSTDEYREIFRHSLWMVPGVKEAKALSKLLSNHCVFKSFNIANVAGDGDDDVPNEEARQTVDNAIGKYPDTTYSITLSCGRLTTGVTIRPWTAVFMLSGSHSTDAKAYMQTIFRVQSPYEINGKRKEECYVFDFAPDRALKCVAEAMKVSTKAGRTSEQERVQLGRFLNFCPIIGFSGTKMQTFNVEHMLERLKNAYVERVVSRGFEDNYLYNDRLLQLDELEMAFFEKLKGVIGSTKANHATDEININEQGFTNEEYEQLKKAQKKKKSELTEEEKQLLAEQKLKRENRNKVISILRGISIRIPLLVYGAELEKGESVTLETFPKLVDDLSWEEFMPRGITKDDFKAISRYYDEDVFRSACSKILSLTKAADDLPPTERVKKIASIFSYFKNPDKETVLTPWRVVNMHMSDCLGGYDFWDENHAETLFEPRYVDRGEVTKNVFAKPDTRILEINSKTGLYPLYVAYSSYMEKRKDFMATNMFAEELDLAQERKIWDEVLKNNIFVVCKTPMAKQITKRTLAGYRDVKVNTRHFKDLINQIINKPNNFIQKMHQGHSYWKAINDDDMKFNAIVGNPPYQVMDGGAQASATPVYNEIVDISKKISPTYISIIMPSRWMTGGKGLDEFRSNMIHDKDMRVLHDYYNSKDIFPTVEIKGGVCYFLWNNKYNEKCNCYRHDEQGVKYTCRFLCEEGDDIFIRESQLISIKNKVSIFELESFEKIVSPRKPYGLSGDVFKNESKYNLPSMSNEFVEDGLTIYGLDEKLKRVKKYVPKDYPFPKTEYISGYKLFMSRNQGSGVLGEEFSVPIFATPNECCTETFIVIGLFETESEMKNCWSYVKTKFFRTMVGIRKQDQGASRAIYHYVPLQDFTEKSDINWNKSIQEIDCQLYKKYNLEQTEIDFIETHIKPMQ